ncbi:hypothetical protein M5K25_013687 [Dendrobium thyrsiflorum]|uniref:Uncharacterized protein n=1 Tax=Dendrobium thyrsiflorum TaxID=117978 RepID=A0ABD0UTR4_DENTH
MLNPNKITQSLSKIHIGLDRIQGLLKLTAPNNFSKSALLIPTAVQSLSFFSGISDLQEFAKGAREKLGKEDYLCSENLLLLSFLPIQML